VVSARSDASSQTLEEEEEEEEEDEEGENVGEFVVAAATVKDLAPESNVGARVSTGRFRLHIR